ncbi:MAG: enoyl-CoA hydratase-related protein [Pseudomonadota bacterium]
MSEQNTIYEVRDGAGWIHLNRPEQRNALSAGLVSELYEHLVAANADDAVRCIVITGNGTAFCAGADLKNPPGSPTAGKRTVDFPTVLSEIWNGPKPVIAAVNGAAFAGGLGLVGAADIVIAAREATMSFSEVRIGVIPAVIAVVCLRKIGPHHGMRLFVTGERFDGARAVELGLAHKAVAGSELQAAVQEEIDAINLGGPIAVQACKKLVRALPDGDLPADFTLAQEWSLRMFKSDEGQEGMAAFREKRRPSWVSSDD